MFGEIKISAPVYVYNKPSDMRLGIDRLVALVHEYNPLQGGYFVFFSRKKERVRILYWDRDGYCVWLKRLEAGVFKAGSKLQSSIELITTDDLQELLSGIELQRILFRKKIQQKGSTESLQPAT